MKKKIASFIVLLFISKQLSAQTIGTFNSVQPTAQTQNFVLPSTHTFQRIIQSGNALTTGGTLGSSLDFTGFVPIGGSSINGYLSISSESTPAQCAILSINYNSTTKLWNTSSSGKVAFPVADIGNVDRFCSGTVTPNNTIMVAEESLTSGDNNGDGYQDAGWIIEIDPATRQVINQDGAGGVDKLWAIGRQSHENVVLTADRSIIYTGADANPTGYLYKFIPSAPGVYTSGLLYVLVTNSALGTGSWALVPNSTVAERNNVPAASTSLGAYNFNGIEDVEIGPDGKIYFAAKGLGQVYRFNDNGLSVSNLEVFVTSTNYDVDGAGPFAPEPWGIGNDNLAFDGDGNLWVLQDGSRNHIWVVGPTHSASTPAIKLFATTPAGSEPTGITFSPDYKFLFLSFQHPSTTNTATQLDASGTSVVFNNHTTIVISRNENLGVQICNVPTGLNATGITQNSANINWIGNSGAISYDVDYKASTSSTWINIVNGTTNLSANISGLQASTFYNFRVKSNCTANSSGYSSANFTTSPTPTTCPSPFDTGTNNTIAGASSIALNTNINGLISPKNDIDHYKFTITTGGTISLNLTTLPANYNLALLNASGTQLAISQNNGTTNETINATVTAGDFYAKVLPKGNASNATNCYTLRINTGTAARISSENSEKENEKEITNEEIKIFPIPAKNMINVEILNFEKSATISIFDLSGKSISKKTTYSKLTELNVENLKNGVYILNINHNGVMKNKKIIKE